VDSIIYRADVLLDKSNLSSEHVRSLSKIRKVADQIAKEIKDLVQTWKEQDRRVIDLQQIIKTALKDVKKPAKISVSLLDSLQHLPPVLGFERQLTDVIVSLLQNAADAMEGCQTGTLSIGGSSRQVQDEVWAVVWIEDTGTGIDESSPIAVEPQPGLSDQSQGMGLATFLAQSFLKRQGGQITWEKRKGGKGTRVTLALPAYVLGTLRLEENRQ